MTDVAITAPPLTALVTGATSGLDKEIAARLARDVNGRVVVHRGGADRQLHGCDSATEVNPPVRRPWSTAVRARRPQEAWKRSAGQPTATGRPAIKRVRRATRPSLPASISRDELKQHVLRREVVHHRRLMFRASADRRQRSRVVAVQPTSRSSPVSATPVGPGGVGLDAVSRNPWHTPTVLEGLRSLLTGDQRLRGDLS